MKRQYPRNEAHHTKHGREAPLSLIDKNKRSTEYRNVAHTSIFCR